MVLGLAVAARTRPSEATAIKNGSVFDAKWPHMHTTVVRAAAAATDASDGPRSLT